MRDYYLLGYLKNYFYIWQNKLYIGTENIEKINELARLLDVYADNINYSESRKKYYFQVFDLDIELFKGENLEMTEEENKYYLSGLINSLEKFENEIAYVLTVDVELRNSLVKYFNLIVNRQSLIDKNRYVISVLKEELKDVM